MNFFSKKQGVPSTTKKQALKGKDLKALYLQLASGWEILEEHHLMKKFTFSSFHDAIDFAKVIGQIAEEENHHPDLHLFSHVLIVKIWTRTVDGLLEKDFTLAAKIEADWVSLKG